MIVIKTSKEASYRVLLKIIEEIRYNNLYQWLEQVAPEEKPTAKIHWWSK